MNNYQAFGLIIQSEIDLPELIALEDTKQKTDVIIKIEDLSKMWLGFPDKSNFYVINCESVIFEVPNTAVILVSKGEKITISPYPNMDEDLLRLYVLGTGMGALLMQRRILPLHGSAIVINGKVYAIVGDSGAGKSTLASAFVKKGYQLISDDLIAVSLDHNTPYIIPSYPQQKLWDSSLREFGMDPEEFNPLFKRENKYAVPVHSSFYTHPLQLGGIFELEKISGNNNVTLTKIGGLERLNKLYMHTFRNFLIPQLNLTKWHFQVSVEILDKINICKIQRPDIGFSVNKIMEEILYTVKGGNKVAYS